MGASPTPLVSVVMSVYNAEAYLREAIASILDQRYENFEFIIIDDGSKDGSLEIIKSFKDARIRLVSRANKGLVASLNEGIGLARGAYIARQDGDDVSTPDRFERQVAALEADTGLGLIGSNYTVIDQEGQEKVTTHVFTHPDDLKLAEPVSNQYGHGSVMMRKSVLDEVGAYDATVGFVEDYDLFVRISKVARIANIADSLYKWRTNPVGITSSNTDTHAGMIEAVRNREFEYIKTHRREYKVFSSWHPLSYYPGPRQYFDQKSRLFRNLAYLYWSRDGDRVRAGWMMLWAIGVAPWRWRNARMLVMLLSNDANSDYWRFEFL